MHTPCSISGQLIKSASIASVLILLLCAMPDFAVGRNMELPPKQLTYFDDAYYLPDRFEGDSIVLKLQMQISYYPAPPEVRLRYFGKNDSHLFYTQFEKQQCVYRCYVDFPVELDTINRLIRVKEISFKQSFISRIENQCTALGEHKHKAFPAKLVVRSCHLDSVFWFNQQFDDSIYFEQVVSRNCLISGCVFNAPIRLEDVNSYHILLPKST